MRSSPYTVSTAERAVAQLPVPAEDLFDHPSGMDRESLRWFEIFENDVDARYVMGIARRVGVPFSQALAAWNAPEDIGAERGYDAWLAKDAAERCQNCGVHPHDMLRDDGRPKYDPPVIARIVSCELCRDVEDEQAKLGKVNPEQRQGKSVRVVTYQPPNESEEFDPA